MDSPSNSSSNNSVPVQGGSTVNVTISTQPTFSTGMPLLGVPIEPATIPVNPTGESSNRYPKREDSLRRSVFPTPPRNSTDSFYSTRNSTEGPRPSFLMTPQRSAIGDSNREIGIRRRPIGVSNRHHERDQEDLNPDEAAQIERTRTLTLWTRFKAFLGLDFHHRRVSQNKKDAFTLVEQSISHGFASVTTLDLELAKAHPNPELVKELRDNFAQDAQNIWELTTAVRSMEATEHEIFMRKSEFIKVFWIVVAGLIGMATFYYAILKPRVGN